MHKLPEERMQPDLMQPVEERTKQYGVQGTYLVAQPKGQGTERLAA